MEHVEHGHELHGGDGARDGAVLPANAHCGESVRDRAAIHVIRDLAQEFRLGGGVGISSLLP